eukprot:scaffold35951_cov48-Phaeocystis_antarctica.AAC.1
MASWWRHGGSSGAHLLSRLLAAYYLLPTTCYLPAYLPTHHLLGTPLSSRTAASGPRSKHGPRRTRAHGGATPATPCAGR